MTRKSEFLEGVPRDDKERCNTAETLAICQSRTSLGEGQCWGKRTSAQRTSLLPADVGVAVQGNSLFITVCAMET